MDGGYVYILHNPKTHRFLKIGKTARDSRARAKEISKGSGVPLPYELAFEVFTLQHSKLEHMMHERLKHCRVNNQREFFDTPLPEAINILLELQPALDSTVTNETCFQAQSIYTLLAQRYKDWLRPAIVDIRIVQTNGRVWLETTEEKEMAGYLVDQCILRKDLAFIGDDAPSENQFFQPHNSISQNANKFVNEMDPYSIISTTDLFREEVCGQIQNDQFPHG